MRTRAEAPLDGAARREVAVVGLGAVTPFGLGVEAFWNGLAAGRSAIREVTLFPAERFRCRLAAEVPAVPDDPVGETSERGHLLALAAAREALGEPLGDGPSLLAGPRGAIAVGTTLGGNRSFTAWLEAPEGSAALLPESTLSSLAALLARRTGARGPVSTLSVACASGTAAIGLAAERIARGEADRALAGGFDALSPFVFSGFDALRALSTTAARPFDARRDGLVLGEGAGFLLLEERRLAEARGARVLALVGAYASAGDAHHMTRPAPDGRGVATAIRAALAAAALRAEDLAFVSAHGTATRFNDRMEAAGYRAALGARAGAVPVNSIKGAIGHTLGAAGALEAVMATLALDRGALPPTAGFEQPDPECPLDVVHGEPRRLEAPRAALSASSAFAGTNAALVLSAA